MNLNKKITFLVNEDTYIAYKIALLSLRRKDPVKYPQNPSLAFRKMMVETIEEYNSMVEKEGKNDKK